MNKIPIILASQSPARLELLKSVNIIPDQVLPAHIDETEHPREIPRHTALRLSYEKATTIAGRLDYGLIIAADTVVVVGRKILPKALSAEEVKFCLGRLSGRRHRIYTGICVILKEGGKMKISRKAVQTAIKFKRLTPKEIDEYAAFGEGINKAGGYSIRGYAESFVEFMSGSYSNVVGLPLKQVLDVVKSFGGDHRAN